jgi:purine-binding chemotaxis protein CheW
LVKNITPPERALIEALLARFPQREPDEVVVMRRWNDAYADSMRLVHKAYPDDLDLRAIFAEAIMNRTPWRMWDQVTGKPTEIAGTLEAQEILETALEESPDVLRHPGILHLYVHLMEMSLRATAPLFRKKYFHAVAGGFELDRAIRSRVRFAYLNLQPGPYPALGEDRFDLVFCRNVMIYFQPETTRRIVARLAGILRPGGYLFLGHAETLQPFSREFSRVQFGGGFYYRRQDPPPTARSPEPEPLPALLPSPPLVAQSAAASPPQPSARLAEFPSALGDPPERGTQYWSHLEEAAELAVADSREYLVIRLGGERFGLEITVVREILRAQKWVRVPAVPEHVLGVFNRRGQIVAVTDLRGALGLPTDGVTPGGRLVVVEGQGMVTALWAEQVEGIRSIPRTAVEPPTPGRVRCHFGGIAGQVQLEDGLLVLLDLPSLLSHPGLVVDQSKD